MQERVGSAALAIGDPKKDERDGEIDQGQGSHPTKCLVVNWGKVPPFEVLRGGKREKTGAHRAKKCHPPEKHPGVPRGGPIWQRDKDIGRTDTENSLGKKAPTPQGKSRREGDNPTNDGEQRGRQDTAHRQEKTFPLGTEYPVPPDQKFGRSL